MPSPEKPSPAPVRDAMALGALTRVECSGFRDWLWRYDEAPDVAPRFPRRVAASDGVPAPTRKIFSLHVSSEWSAAAARGEQPRPDLAAARLTDVLNRIKRSLLDASKPGATPQRAPRMLSLVAAAGSLLDAALAIPDDYPADRARRTREAAHRAVARLARLLMSLGLAPNRAAPPHSPPPLTDTSFFQRLALHNAVLTWYATLVAADSRGGSVVVEGDGGGSSSKSNGKACDKAGRIITGSANSHAPSSTAASSWDREEARLLAEKRNAVAREDFIEAQRIKQALERLRVRRRSGARDGGDDGRKSDAVAAGPGSCADLRSEAAAYRRGVIERLLELQATDPALFSADTAAAFAPPGAAHASAASGPRACINPVLSLWRKALLLGRDQNDVNNNSAAADEAFRGAAATFCADASQKQRGGASVAAALRQRLGCLEVVWDAIVNIVTPLRVTERDRKIKKSGQKQRDTSVVDWTGAVADAVRLSRELSGGWALGVPDPTATAHTPAIPYSKLILRRLVQLAVADPDGDSLDVLSELWRRGAQGDAPGWGGAGPLPAMQLDATPGGGLAVKYDSPSSTSELGLFLRAFGVYLRRYDDNSTSIKQKTGAFFRASAVSLRHSTAALRNQMAVTVLLAVHYPAKDLSFFLTCLGSLHRQGSGQQQHGREQKGVDVDESDRLRLYFIALRQLAAVFQARGKSLRPLVDAAWAAARRLCVIVTRVAADPAAQMALVNTAGVSSGRAGGAGRAAERAEADLRFVLERLFGGILDGAKAYCPCDEHLVAAGVPILIDPARSFTHRTRELALGLVERLLAPPLFMQRGESSLSGAGGSSGAARGSQSQASSLSSQDEFDAMFGGDEGSISRARLARAIVSMAVSAPPILPSLPGRGGVSLLRAVEEMLAAHNAALSSGAAMASRSAAQSTALAAYGRDPDAPAAADRKDAKARGSPGIPGLSRAPLSYKHRIRAELAEQCLSGVLSRLVPLCVEQAGGDAPGRYGWRYFLRNGFRGGYPPASAGGGDSRRGGIGAWAGASGAIRRVARGLLSCVSGPCPSREAYCRLGGAFASEPIRLWLCLALSPTAGTLVRGLYAALKRIPGLASFFPGDPPHADRGGFAARSGAVAACVRAAAARARADSSSPIAGFWAFTRGLSGTVANGIASLQRKLKAAASLQAGSGAGGVVQDGTSPERAALVGYLRLCFALLTALLRDCADVCYHTNSRECALPPLLHVLLSRPAPTPVAKVAFGMRVGAFPALVRAAEALDPENRDSFLQRHVMSVARAAIDTLADERARRERTSRGTRMLQQLTESLLAGGGDSGNVMSPCRRAARCLCPLVPMTSVVVPARGADFQKQTWVLAVVMEVAEAAAAQQPAAAAGLLRAAALPLLLALAHAVGEGAAHATKANNMAVRRWRIYRGLSRLIRAASVEGAAAEVPGEGYPWAALFYALLDSAARDSGAAPQRKPTVFPGEFHRGGFFGRPHPAVAAVWTASDAAARPRPAPAVPARADAKVENNLHGAIQALVRDITAHRAFEAVREACAEPLKALCAGNAATHNAMGGGET